MINEIILLAGTFITLLLQIAIFSTKPRSRQQKLLLFISANIIFIVSFLLIYLHTPLLPDTIILGLLVGILDIFAIIKMLSKEDIVLQQKYAAWHDDPANWKLGIFYYNPQDKRIFPPKKIEGLGWTINFANPYSVLTTIAVTVFSIIIIQYFGL